MVPVSCEVPPQLLARPFSVSSARGLGVPAKVLRGRRFRQVFRGIYVSSAIPDTLSVRTDAARLLLPSDAAFSHRTAAELRRLPLLPDEVVHATCPFVHRPRIRGIAVHQGDPRPLTQVAGRPVVSAERNFLELAASLSLVDLVVVGDAMVRHGWTSAEKLRASATQTAGLRGARIARRAAALVRPRVDSPMETRTRLLLVLAGLPCPVPGSDVLDEDGQWVATVDLQYDTQRIALEYDGDLHRTSRCKWRNDVSTRERLRDLGWLVLVVTADDILDRPEEVLRRVGEALVERRHPAVPRLLDPRWRTHFPSRRP